MPWSLIPLFYPILSIHKSFPRSKTMELGRGKKRNKRGDRKAENPCPHVPEGIVVSILSKLPVKSLLRFRCVSNSWLSIISDPEFKLATQRQHVIIMSSQLPTRTVNQWRFSIHLIDDEASVTELPIPKPLRQDLSQGGPRLRGSCNRLLVSSGQDLFLWNPFARCCNKVLSHYRLSNYQCCGLLNSGLCYDSFTDDYKVVMAFAWDGFVVVGSLRNKTWTSEICFPYNKEDLKSRPTVNDRVHRLVCEGSEVEPYLIVSFDPQTNEFVEVPMPDDEQIKGTIVLVFGVLDGCLSLVLSNDNTRPNATEIEVLAMTKYGDKASWVSLFKLSDLLPFDPTFSLAVPLCSTASREVLIQWEAVQWRILACDPEHNWHREFPISNHRGHIYCADMFVESLVSPPSYDWDEEAFTEIFLSGETHEMRD